MQQVSQMQLGILFIIFHVSTSTGFLMTYLFSLAAYDGWIAILISMGGGLLITYAAYVLALRRPGEFFVKYGKELLGSWLHVPLMGVFCFFFLHMASMVLREVTDFLIQVFLPTTPSWMVSSLFAFVVVITIRTGIEAIFRCASGFFFFTIAAVLITPILVSNEVNYDRAIALITHLNWANSWKASFPFIPWFGEMFLILFLFPHLMKPKRTYFTVLWSSLISVCIIEIFYILCFLMFGHHLSAQLAYPVLEMIRFIKIGDFLENLDPFLVAIWLSSLFIKVTLLLYVAVLIFTQLVGLKDMRPFGFSFGALMLGMSMHIVKSMIEMSQFILFSWPTFALVLECLPIVYLLAAIIRKKRVPA